MSRKFISIILFIAFTIVGIGLAIYFLTSYSYTKLFSFINFYDKDLTVTLNEISYVLKPFDTKLVEVKDIRQIQIQATIEEKIVFEEFMALPYSPQIIATYFSDSPHCYYQTNLSIDINTLEYIKVEPTSKVWLLDDVDLENNYYFVPGSESPNYSKSNGKIISILPIACELINDKALVLANNQLFINYNSELQREYYFQNIDKINESSTLEEIGGVKGVQNNRLNYYYFGGKDFYFIP